MGELALVWNQEAFENTVEYGPKDTRDVQRLKVGEKDYLVLYRGQLLASYDHKDKYTRN